MRNDRQQRSPKSSIDRAIDGAAKARNRDLKPGDQDWSRKCDLCGMTPTVFMEKNDPAPLCGPCTWGEADTMGGNW